MTAFARPAAAVSSVICALGLAACGSGSPASSSATHTPSASVSTSAAPSPSPTSGTVNFTDPEGHFSATFFSLPTKQATTRTIGGVTIPVVLWVAQGAGNEAQLAGYSVYPSSSDVSRPQANLDAATAGAVAAVKGTVVSQRNLTYEGHPAEEAVARVAGGYTAYRYILDGHTMFIVGEGSAAAPNDFDAFASTLRIMNP